MEAERLAFKLYAMECEGLINTYQGILNATIRHLLDYNIPLNEAEIKEAWTYVGGDIYELDSEDIHAIARHVYNQRIHAC